LKPPVLIIHAPGTNRDHDAAEAFALAGGRPEIVTLAALAEVPRRVRDYRLICVPGGFSFGDDLGAGRVFALNLVHFLGDVLREHLVAGRPILGICNGFQTLVKAGFLPGLGVAPSTLTRNLRGHFECRRVELVASPASTSPWITPLAQRDHRIHCPVAHGEGRLVPGDDATAEALRGPLGALRYVPSDSPDGYPGNPNGSFDHLAGVTDPSGLVLGLMPHPEDAVLGLLDPDPLRRTPSGLPLFEAGLALAADTS